MIDPMAVSGFKRLSLAVCIALASVFFACSWTGDAHAWRKQAKKPPSKEEIRKDREKEKRRLLRKTLLAPNLNGKMPTHLTEEGWAILDDRPRPPRGIRINYAEPTYVRGFARLMLMDICLARIQSGHASPEDEVVFSANAVSAANLCNKTLASTFSVAEGEKATLDDLLFILARDAAPAVVVAIAEHISKDGTIESILDEMNERAKELRLKETRYFSIDGSRFVVDEDEDKLFSTTSARDTATLFRQLLSRPSALRYLAPEPFTTKLGAKKNKERVFLAGSESSIPALLASPDAVFPSPGQKSTGCSLIAAWKTADGWRVSVVLGAKSLFAAAVSIKPKEK